MPETPARPTRRYSFLGPEGTFTEQALRSMPRSADAELLAAPTVTVALDAVRSGGADGAVVPIENSVEGSVPVTLDELATGQPLMITAEIAVPVAFSLLVRPGTRLGDVRRIATHPHAGAQTRGWVAEHLPDAELLHASSTAQAAAALATGSTGPAGSAVTAPLADPAGPEGAAPWDAAISAPLAAERYGLEALADGIGDNADAVTRFVLVAPPGPPPAPTGRDKTSLVAFMHEDHPGALLEILDQLTMRGVNLTRIESRPTRRGLGDYCFSIDAEGHLADQRVGEALMGLRRVCADVRFLGSYERHDGRSPQIRAGTTDGEFIEATRWLARLRSG